jgi:hypothetical protein
MDLVILVLVVVLIGWLVYLLTTRVPMPPFWARTIQVLALALVVLYVVSHFVHLPNVLTR